MLQHGLGAVLALAVGSSSPDPLAGSWRANLAASRFAAGIPRPRSLSMTCVVQTAARISCEATRITSSGRRKTARFSARYDGRPYPVTGLRTIDRVTLRRAADAVTMTFSEGSEAVIASRIVRSAVILSTLASVGAWSVRGRTRGFWHG